MKPYGTPSRLFPVAKDRHVQQTTNVCHQTSKRAKCIKKTRDEQIYKCNRAEFKEMVLKLTCTNPSSQQSDGPRPSPLAHVSTPQPVRLNDAPIPPLPYRYPPVPTITNAVNTSTPELSNTQPPSPPSHMSPPSPPSFPSSLPPPSPREEESMEASVAAFMDYFENRMAEDDTNQEHISAWSPLIPSIPTSDEEQQHENIPPHVPANPSSEILDSPDCPADLRSDNIPPSIPATLPSENLVCPRSLNDLRSENIPPPVTSTLPSRSLDWSSFRNNLPSENIPPPILSMNPPYVPTHPNHLRSDNITPPVPTTLPSMYQLDGLNHLNHLWSENMPPPVTTALPSGNLLRWPNSQNDLRPENILPPAFGTVPSWDLDLPSYPSVLRSTSFPPPAPTTLPSGRLPE